MSGEHINAKTIEEYWQELKLIYQRRSLEWKDLTQEEYEAIERSEREDSDNHLNQERLGKDTNVIDMCHYKFMPDRSAAYHVEIITKDGASEHYCFQLKLKQNIEQ